MIPRGGRVTEVEIEPTVGGGDGGGGSYQCLKCGGVIPLLRRAAHDQFWCSTNDSDEDGVVEAAALSVLQMSVEPTPLPLPLPLLAASLQPACHSVATVALSGWAHKLVFEQQNLFGPLSTGAVLWASEVVLAELLLQLHAAKLLPSPFSSRCIVLGGGLASVSAMVACALGYHTVLTDLPLVLPDAKRNFQRNHDVIQEAALRLSPTHSMGPIEVEALRWGESFPPRIQHLATTEYGFGLVLCCDCLYWPDLHAPLAASIASLFHLKAASSVQNNQSRTTTFSPSCALIAFQLREGNHTSTSSSTPLPPFAFAREHEQQSSHNPPRPPPFGGGSGGGERANAQQFFRHVEAMSHTYGLQCEPVDISRALQLTDWAPAMQSIIRQTATRLEDFFFVVKLTLRV